MAKPAIPQPNEIKIDAQFPAPSADGLQIKKEVVEILRLSLQEQLQKAEGNHKPGGAL